MNRLHDNQSYAFASDNYSGVHPKIIQALTIANGGHQPAYGADVYTLALQQKIKQLFGEQAEAFPVFNGTGANVTALQALLPRWGAVICAESAHIQCDEGVAPEHLAGVKLLTVATDDGKLTPQLVARQAWGFGMEHRAQPAVVYISQTTELGTCYSVAEIRDLAEYCHKHNMQLYLDGARLANALVAENTDVRTMVTDTGVDMLNLGGTKNGMLQGECIISMRADTHAAMPYLRKINAQLGAKMRFISAQFLAWLEDDLWLDLAAGSNLMAKRLAASLTAIEQVSVTQKVQANAIFAILPANARARLHQQFHFYDWDESKGEVRWMTSFDTTTEQVDAFAAAIRQAVAEK
ncbi:MULTISPECIES: low specificity L-threonine aldolase [unclassified Snodgrassella]|uniref:threonine aldolase family protein n=1 Tax=unclassified Snodgrassella TaxID=2625236 RepID=UPI0018DEC996|nr:MULTISPECIES: beta-eliminating lyase-related protein [unclassified Snodgrassella]MBI0098720.1 threonine aldolase [Snodgrassella sp. W8134]MBI0102512.1 threonine aldolase [Snodgrassella sp. W8135]